MPHLSTGLVIWTVYENPSDYPGKFVVRAWEAINGKPVPREDCTVSDTLDKARASVPEGLVRMDRGDDDDPCIVETWI